MSIRLASAFIGLAATLACHQPSPGLPAGLVPQVSADLARGDVAGIVLDSASRSALAYAQVILLSDTGSAASP